MEGRNNYVLFFDVECLLCNGFVQFIIMNDSSNNFRFASLNGSFARSILDEKRIKEGTTVILYDGERIYFKSSAILRCFKKLNGWWKLVFLLNIIPKNIRDLFYDFISSNRYRIIKRKSSCIMITPEIKHKFIDF